MKTKTYYLETLEMLHDNLIKDQAELEEPGKIPDLTPTQFCRTEQAILDSINALTDDGY